MELSRQFGTSEYFKKVSEGTQPPALFATAKEIWHNTHPVDLDAPYSQENSQGNKEDLWHESKAHLLQHKQFSNPALTNSIKKIGFDWKHSQLSTAHPVELRDDVLLNGHHRVAKMLEHHPNQFIPIFSRL
jgi:hypothetical protein